MPALMTIPLSSRDSSAHSVQMIYWGCNCRSTFRGSFPPKVVFTLVSRKLFGIWWCWWWLEKCRPEEINCSHMLSGINARRRADFCERHLAGQENSVKFSTQGLLFYGSYRRYVLWELWRFIRHSPNVFLSETKWSSETAIVLINHQHFCWKIKQSQLSI